MHIYVCVCVCVCVYVYVYVYVCMHVYTHTHTHTHTVPKTAIFGLGKPVIIQALVVAAIPYNVFIKKIKKN